MRNSELFKLAIAKGLKIGNVDLENSPELSWHYGNWQVNIDPVYTEVPSQITSIAIKDLKTGKIKVKGWKVPKGKFGFMEHDKDKDLLKDMIPRLREYDILIGQNHINFDIKKFNWRLNLLELPSLDNLLMVDTLIESRKVFLAPSHKLNFKSHAYGNGGKIKQDFGDCVDVAKGKGDKTALRLKYNAKDTDDDDKVFWRELDYYKLPKALVNMLKLYISTDDPTFCIKCAARKEARFDIKKNKTKNGYNLICNRCDYSWSI